MPYPVIGWYLPRVSATARRSRGARPDPPSQMAATRRRTLRTCTSSEARLTEGGGGGAHRVVVVLRHAGGGGGGGGRREQGRGLPGSCGRGCAYMCARAEARGDQHAPALTLAVDEVRASSVSRYMSRRGSGWGSAPKADALLPCKGHHARLHDRARQRQPPARLRVVVSGTCAAIAAASACVISAHRPGGQVHAQRVVSRARAGTGAPTQSACTARP